jgi:hypothetical protein
MSRRTAESNKAILAAWIKEQELVKEGKGTRNWTSQQQQDILEIGKAYDDNGKAFEGQHMKSAEMYPEYQGSPGNIQFLTRAEHLEAHGGSWQNPTNWYFNPVTKEKIDFGDGPFIPCEIIQLSAPIISLTDNSTIKEIFIEKKEDSSKADVLKQSIGLRRKTYGKLEPAKTHTVQIEIPEKSNNAFVKGLKSFGRFIVEHPVETLEFVGLTIGCVVKAVVSIKGRDSGSTHRIVSNSENSSVADKIVDIVEKASRSLPSENDVKGHKQRYHTKSGVVWKDKAPYHRGGK